MTHPPLDELKSAVLDPAPRIRDVIADAPRLASTVETLESDRREILAQFDMFATTRRADGAAAERLMARLNEYRQRAADLLYQAYGVDLGGET
jgi:hypothetical protein